MHDQANARPAATSVADYYERAFKRVLLGLVTDGAPRMAGSPTWEESALCALLTDLAAGRRERLEHHDWAMAKDRSDVAAGDRGELLAHVDRMGRVAAEIAAINTLLHWGWIDGERLVKIGAGLLDQVEIPEDDDRQGGQK